MRPVQGLKWRIVIETKSYYTKKKEAQNYTQFFCGLGGLDRDSVYKAGWTWFQNDKDI